MGAFPEKEILEELGATLGSDVPFLYGGTALAEGRGELVRPSTFPADKGAPGCSRRVGAFCGAGL